MIFPIAVREKGSKNYLYKFEPEKPQENLSTCIYKEESESEILTVEREPIIIGTNVLEDGTKIPMICGCRYKVTRTKYLTAFPQEADI